jgi:hypothetical protein
VGAQVLPDWVPSMTDRERRECFDDCLLGGGLPPPLVLVALCRAMRGSPVPVEVAALLGRLLQARRSPDMMPSPGALVLFLSRYEVPRTDIMGVQERRGSVALGLESVLRAAGGGGATTVAGALPDIRLDGVINALVSLPDAAANALQRAAPRWAAPEPYFVALARAMLGLLREVGAPPNAVLPPLLGRLARLQRTPALARIWVPALLLGPAEAAAPLAALLDSIGDGDFEQTLCALLAAFPLEPAPSRGADREPSALLAALLAPRLRCAPPSALVPRSRVGWVPAHVLPGAGGGQIASTCSQRSSPPRALSAGYQPVGRLCDT